ncbi:MAG: phage tail spike protein, partial [Clostridia bacterium]|nr:phage tail spike protein [Clostridia bacterium]
MVDIYVYDKSGDDTSTTGLVGALVPVSCEHEEIGNGMSSVSLVHPYDEWDKWKALETGNILSVPVRVRTTPVIEGSGTYVTSVEKWTVKQGATQTQLRVFRKKKKNNKIGKLTKGSTVYVLEKGDERYKVKYLKASKNRTAKDIEVATDITIAGQTWREGWVDPAALDFDTVETISDTASGIEDICPSGELVSQLFRIQSVEYDVDAGQINVYAVHISYDLSNMVTVYKNDEPLNAVTALAGIIDGIEQEHDFEAFTDLANVRTSCDWVDVSPSTALLDPSEGFAERWDAELVRDDYSLYFLADGGANRGIRIEHGKNLIGAQMEMNWDEMVTVVKPYGVTKKGNPLYLVTDGDDEEKDTYDAGNYIYSPNASVYGEYVRAIECDDCTVEKGKKGVTVAVARARMREQVAAMFEGDDAVDKPKISLSVNFQQLGRTAEYEQYKPLENLYLWDRVTVTAKTYGVEVTAKVTRIVLDVLTNQVNEIDIGNVERSSKIYSWQLPTITGDLLSGNLRDNETPVIALSGTSLLIVADSDGKCPMTEATFYVTARKGYIPVDPVVDEITGAPEGMTISQGEIIEEGVLPIIVNIADGATLGSAEQCSGQISILVSSPDELTLTLNWAKACKGVDGGGIEFIFCRTTEYAAPALDTSAVQQDDYVPDGWTDEPNGVNAALPYEWSSTRTKSDGTWSTFSSPVIWAHYGEDGEDGRDGKSVEYVYRRTTDYIAPALTTTAVQTDDYVPSGWTDDPTGVSS